MQMVEEFAPILPWCQPSQIGDGGTDGVGGIGKIIEDIE
jgi:hypothetical protein